MSAPQAAAYCGMSKGSWEKHIKPKIRELRLGVKTVRYDRSQIDRLVDVMAGNLEIELDDPIMDALTS